MTVHKIVLCGLILLVQLICGAPASAQVIFDIFSPPVAVPPQTPGPSVSLYNSHPYYVCNTNYYVYNGSTSGSGTIGSPWTLAQALAQSVAGGSCFNMAVGVYTVTGTNPVSFTNGGTGPATNQYVVWRCSAMPFSYSGGVLQGEGSGCVIRQSGSQTGAIVSGMSSYMMFDGLELDGNNFAAGQACVDDENTSAGHHHLWMLNSNVHGCGQSGIQWNETDWLFVIHCNLHDNSATNGAAGSGLSIFQPASLNGYSPTPGNPDYWHSNTTGRTYHIVVAYSYAYHNYNDPTKFTATDGEGLNFDTFGWTGCGAGSTCPYNASVLVMGNVVYGNGGEGIEHEFSIGPPSATSEHLDVINNTAYSNAWTVDPCCGFGAGILLNQAENVTAWNNITIAVTSPSRGCVMSGSTCSALDQGGAAGTDQWLTNMTYPGGLLGFQQNSNFAANDGNNDYPTTSSPFSSGCVAASTCNTDGTDPMLTSLTPVTSIAGSGGSNFALRSGSPAIGRGKTFDLWQQSGTVDIGACAYSAPGPVANCP